MTDVKTSRFTQQLPFNGDAEVRSKAHRPQRHQQRQLQGTQGSSGWEHEEQGTTPPEAATARRAHISRSAQVGSLNNTIYGLYRRSRLLTTSPSSLKQAGRPSAAVYSCKQTGQKNTEARRVRGALHRHLGRCRSMPLAAAAEEERRGGRFPHVHSVRGEALGCAVVRVYAYRRCRG